MVRVLACAGLIAVVLFASQGHAEPIRIVAGSEIRIAPRLRGDRSALDVVVRVTDDHGAIAHGQVELTSQQQGSVLHAVVQTAAIGANGQAQFVVRPDPTAPGVMLLHAEFHGSERTAQAEADARVDLDAPFITLGLRVPATSNYGDPPVEAIVDVDVGEVVPLNPAGLEVGLRVDDRIVATGAAEATGRVAIRIPSADLGGPGVRTVRAELQRGADVLRSPARRIVVRAPTTLTLGRSSSTDRGATLVGALVTRAGPVVGGAVQVVWNEQLLGAALTSDDGTFALQIDRDITVQPDVVAQAIFNPAEPWFGPSRSGRVRLTLARAAPVRWPVLAVPATLALMLFALVAWRTRVRGRRVSLTPPQPLANAGSLAHVAERNDGIALIRTEAFDLATGTVLVPFTVEWRIAGGEFRPGDEVRLEPSARFEVRVAAAGHAPRTLAATAGRASTYVLRIGLKSWREELFDRLRSWMAGRGAAGAAVIPTPTEALADAEPSPPARALVAFVESGVYGRDDPGEPDVTHADSLLASTAPDDASSVDAPN